MCADTQEGKKGRFALFGKIQRVSDRWSVMKRETLKQNARLEFFALSPPYSHTRAFIGLTFLAVRSRKKKKRLYNHATTPLPTRAFFFLGSFI